MTCSSLPTATVLSGTRGGTGRERREEGQPSGHERAEVARGAGRHGAEVSRNGSHDLALVDKGRAVAGRENAGDRIARTVVAMRGCAGSAGGVGGGSPAGGRTLAAGFL